MLLMMHITMDAQPFVQQLMDKESFLVEPKDKLEFGELLSKSNIWKLPLNSIVEEFGQFKLTEKILKL